MIAHAVFSCISVLTVLQAARPVLSYNHEEDADSISIDIETNTRNYEYTAGQLMNFSCILKGGLEQYANLSLSIDGAVNKSVSCGKRMVSLSKVAEESDNDRHLRCYMWYEGFRREPYIVSHYLNIFYPPRAAEELQNGTYKASGDFRVGEVANVTVRFRANPKPYLVIWELNGRHLDSNRFQPWASDQFLFQDGTWVAGFSISKVTQHDFQSVFQLKVSNKQGHATIPVKMPLQEIADASGCSITEDWSKFFFILVVICVALLVALTVLSWCYLQIRKRFQEISTINELQQVECTNCSSALKKEANHNETNLNNHSYQAIEGGEQPVMVGTEDELSKAVRAGTAEEVRNLLEGGADAETKINNGSNSLHILAQKSTNDQQPANFSTQQEEASHLNVGTVMKNLKKQNSQNFASNEKLDMVVTGAELMKTVRAGNEEEVRKLLEGGADVETKTETGSNSLHIAAQSGFLNIVQLLCEKVQNVDTTNDKNKTALMYATEKGHLEVVKCLLFMKSNGGLVDDNGNTLLHMAVSSGNLELVEMFVKSANKVPDVNATSKDHKTALSIAIEDSKAEACELLIAYGAHCTEAWNYAAKFGKKEKLDVIYKNTPSECREECVRNAHFEAVEYGKLDIFKHICRLREANPQALDSDGDTFLHFAAKKGHLHCMPFILEYMKESVDVRNRKGQTALMHALHCNQQEVVEWLLGQKADTHAVDEDGTSCLHWAAAGGNVHLVQICLDAAIDINSQNKFGWTALYRALIPPSKHVVKYLLEKEADHKIKNISGNTCLHIACEYDSLECVKMLVELLPLNCTNKTGKTPLHVAALKGKKETVAFLLEEAKKQNLEPVDSETIVRLTKRIGEVEKDSEIYEAVKNEISGWHYILKDV